MKTIGTCLIFGAVFAAKAAAAACEMPSLVAVPDGATATEAELLAAQAEVQAYVAAMDRYIACENEAIQTSGNDAANEFLYLMSTRIESARNEVDTIATRFNDEVKAFRAARQATAPLLQR